MWEQLISPITSIINKLIPDKAAQQAAAAQLQQLVTTGELQQELLALQAVTSAQTDINKVEAGATSLFIAGWRPYVGWICGTALGFDCILRPLVNWIAVLAGHPVNLPTLNDPLLQSTLGGILGLGQILRTYEKKQGVAGSH